MNRTSFILGAFLATGISCRKLSDLLGVEVSQGDLRNDDLLIFEDNFNKLDFSNWQHEIKMGGGNAHNEFQMYLNSRVNSFADDGVLYIQPTLSTETYPDKQITDGAIDLYGSTPASACTSNAYEGCLRDVSKRDNQMNPPVQSASLRTYGKFGFKYGRIEVRAQLPKGDWLRPQIQLLPVDEVYGGGAQSGVITLMEGHGNKCGEKGTDTFTSSLAVYPHDPTVKEGTDMRKVLIEHQSDVDLSDDFHTYGFVWSEDEFYTYIDDDSNRVIEMDMVEGSNYSVYEHLGEEAMRNPNPWKNADQWFAPFDQEFYIVMNVAVGGTSGYFADGDCDKPWNNDDKNAVNKFYHASEGWYESWDYPETNQAAMKVDSVKVWRLEDKE